MYKEKIVFERNQKIIFGENIQEIMTWLKGNNIDKIFLLSGKNSFEASGAKSYLHPILSRYKHILYSDFSENPKIKDVYKGIKIFKKEKCDCCIAVGGGSVIDMGKLICYLKDETTNEPILIVQKKLKKITRKAPLCVIPTTAGSGAESTHFSVVYIDNKKYSLAHDTILPDLVNLNAKLSYSMSPYLRAVTGLDALAQGIESYWSKNATDQSQEYSLKAIELVWNNLQQSVLENDFEAHSNVVLGANYAGRAINIAKTTAAHAISYFFTSKHNIKHGHAVALTLGKVYDFNYKRAMNVGGEKKALFNKLNHILRIKDSPKIVIEKFIADLSIELDYSKLHIDINQELPLIIDEVNSERLQNNPFKIKKNDFKKLILNNLNI